MKIVAAEPMQGEPVQGLRSLEDGFIPPIIDLSLLDRKIFVTNRDAIVWTKKLLDEEAYEAACSDAHRPADADVTAEAIGALEKRVGTKEAERLLKHGPRAILGL